MSNFYGVTTVGGRLRFGLPITDDLGASVFGGVEQKTIQMALNDGASPPNPYPQSLLVTDGQVFNKAFIGYGLNFNSLDDDKHPTTGLYATFTQQYVGWDFNYLRTEAKARYFVPILGESGIVGSVRGQAGILNDFSGAGIHPVEAFQPGATLIRGFQAQGVGAFLTNGEFLGATEYAGLSAEVQFPLPMLPESYGLSGALWADTAYITGTPFTGGNPVKPGSLDQNFKSSVGGSIIWDSPFGPLRGDVGYVVNKATDDKTQVFQLTLQSLL